MDMIQVVHNLLYLAAFHFFDTGAQFGHPIEHCCLLSHFLNSIATKPAATFLFCHIKFQHSDLFGVNTIAPREGVAGH
jgi:hypothetical protein